MLCVINWFFLLLFVNVVKYSRASTVAGMNNHKVRNSCMYDSNYMTISYLSEALYLLWPSSIYRCCHSFKSFKSSNVKTGPFLPWKRLFQLFLHFLLIPEKKNIIIINNLNKFSLCFLPIGDYWGSQTSHFQKHIKRSNTII